MTKDMIKIINVETGEEIEREMTDAEQKARDKEIKELTAAKVERENKAEAKAAQKAALLERLGITQEEANLLLG
jgi:hypothetical protein